MQRHETHFFLSFWLLSDRCYAVPTRLLDYFSLPEWPRPRKAAFATKKLRLHPYSTFCDLKKSFFFAISTPRE